MSVGCCCYIAVGVCRCLEVCSSSSSHAFFIYNAERGGAGRHIKYSIMCEVLIFVSIIAGIFSLVLFLKVWDTAKDIKKIKGHLMPENYLVSDNANNSVINNNVREAYLKGDMHIAQDLLTEKLLEKLLYSKIYDNHSNVNSIITQYEQVFNSLGFEIPEQILKLKEDSGDIAGKIQKEESF